MSATRCKAVGYYLNASSVDETLIESWNGSAWTISTSPNPSPGTGTGTLAGVSCVSATSCEAVGDYRNAGYVYQTLIESWNGVHWTISPSPNSGAGNNGLESVSCISTTSCMAVGGGDGTLIESWNGSAWTVSTSPNPSKYLSAGLSSVSCVSATSCQAVGNYVNASGIDKTLIESWNGSAWTLSKSPNPSTSANDLFGVSCVSATSCQAVGRRLNASSVYRILIQSWTGSAWTVSTSPNRGTNANALYGVSCVSATSCKAVGSYVNASSVDKTLVESFG